ncbi:hypothetical protein EVAR_43539_1 [Eumeta japonica]|uniref:Uncharacterized protein n=1 Tax=Eumeta variegata TaxID=151549 RepID=A0A4C1W8Z7_EUMVA|nr:hypothetical protein EVAR_43539_1 [Eumeta japonica]
MGAITVFQVTKRINGVCWDTVKYCRVHFYFHVYGPCGSFPVSSSANEKAGHFYRDDRFGITDKRACKPRKSRSPPPPIDIQQQQGIGWGARTGLMEGKEGDIWGVGWGRGEWGDGEESRPLELLLTG